MAATHVCMSLYDAQGFVGRSVEGSEAIGVELHSADEARRLVVLLREFADFVEEQTHNPCSLETWARTTETPER